MTTDARKSRLSALRTAIDRRKRVFRSRPGTVLARRQAKERIERLKNPRKTRNPKPRKRTTMAHRSPAQKAAFRRMIAGRKASIAGKPRRRRRRRNGGGSATLANPRRRRRRALARRRRNPPAIRSNPMSRRSRRSSRRRRNPGGALMESIGLLFKAGIPGVIGGGLFGVVDAKLLSDTSPIVRVGSKVGVAFLAGLLLRRHPIAAASAIGGIIGSASYSGAMSLAGGVSAPSPVAAVKGMGVLLRTDKRAMGILIEQMKGMGLQVLQSTPKLGAAGQGPRLQPLPGGQVVGAVNLG